MGTFSVGNRKIGYVVRRSDGSKYAHLRFKRDHLLEITIPKDSDINVKDLLKKKRAWIESKYEEMLNKKMVFHKGNVLFRGKCFQVRVANSPRAKAGTVETGTSEIKVFVGKDEDPRDALRNWMKEKTTNYAKRKIRGSAKRYGIDVGHVIVKETKRWGYCTRKGDIMLNWQLIALPRELAEYVILHELAHLSEFSHSKGFHTRLAAMCPDFKEREDELKKYHACEPDTRMVL